MHYGESLAYWYLRLNGFFPLSRFVMHRQLERNPEPSDVDLLAIRLPGVVERVGGRDIDWDRRLFDAIGASPEHDVVGLIVEVKANFNAYADPENAFDENHVEDGLKRFGTFGPAYVVADARRALNDTHSYSVACPRAEGQPEQKIVVAKLLVGNKFARHVQPVQAAADSFHMLLGDMHSFIQHRIRTNLGKLSDWNFFPSELFQWLLWNERGNLPYVP